MYTRLSLDGADWQLKAYLGEDWRWRDAHLPVNRDHREWIAASVPGSIHADLLRAGRIPDPYRDMNSLLVEWIPDRTWVYRKHFRVDAELAGNRATLVFSGVDYQAEFFLNGTSLGTHTGMFTAAIFDVTEYLLYEDENVIAVVIDPAPHEVSQVGRTSQVRTHKTRMSYGWDFSPRLVHLGIWDQVAIEFTGAARITDVCLRPVLSEDLGAGRLDVEIEVDANSLLSVQAVVTLLDGEHAAAYQQVRAELQPGSGSLSLSLHVDAVRLWNINGVGETVLYRAEIALLAFDPAVPGMPDYLDERSLQVGFRRIDWIANAGASPDAEPYSLVINGEQRYINGWNWVPIDVMYGVPRPDKLRHLFGLLRDAHVNLLRVWGGGLIEREDFYQLADQYGILIWQEFILSSSAMDNLPSDQPEYVALIAGEAEHIIRQKRNHPALAVWCGGNELTFAPEKPLTDEHPLMAALHQRVMKLDPDRRWLPTSPSGRVFMNSLENIERDPNGLHDVHGPWEYQGVTGQYTLYNRGTSLLHSEFGVEGITHRRTLDYTIRAADMLPPTLDNPVWAYRGAWWNAAKVWREIFGEIDDLDQYIRAAQLIQAEGLRYALEANRRRQPQNSGSIPWQFNEPYPMATSTSAVDYYGVPKPVYYAVSRAYAPTSITAAFPTIAWSGQQTFKADLYLNSVDIFTDAVQVQARLIGASGQVYHEQHETVLLTGLGSASAGSVRFPLSSIADPVFFLDLRLLDGRGHVVNTNRYPFSADHNLSPLLRVRSTKLTHAVEFYPDRWNLLLMNAGTHAALWVQVEDARERGTPGFVRFSANHLVLFSGESRTIMVTWDGVPFPGRQLAISGWNTELLVLGREQ